MWSETSKTCPVYCRKCGVELLKESKVLKGVQFNDSESPLTTSKVVFDYRVTLVCPARFGFFGFLRFNHDRREFNEDCTKEYTN